MVDNRSAGFFGIGGAFNFRSGDISGTAAKLSDDKMGQGGEYANLRKGEGEEDQTHGYPYMDRSAVLRATLNSLAMMNVADVIKAKKRGISDDDEHSGKDQQQEDRREKQEKANKAAADENLGEDFDFADKL